MLRYNLVGLLLHFVIYDVHSVCSPGKLNDFSRILGKPGLRFRKKLPVSELMRTKLGATESVVDTFQLNQSCNLIAGALRVSFLGRCDVRVLASEAEGSALLGRGHIIYDRPLSCEENGHCWTTKNAWVISGYRIQGMVVAVRVFSRGNCTVRTDGQGRWEGATLYTIDIDECLNSSHGCQTSSRCENTLGSYQCLGITVASSASTANTVITGVPTFKSMPQITTPLLSYTTARTTAREVTSSIVPVTSTTKSVTTGTPSTNSTPHIPSSLLSSTTAVTPRRDVTSTTLDVKPLVTTNAFSPGNCAFALEAPVVVAILVSVAAILMIGGLLTGCVIGVRSHRLRTLQLSPCTNSSANTFSLHPTRNSMEVANAMYEIPPTDVTSASAQPAPDSNYSTLFQTSHSEQQESQTRNATGDALFQLNATSDSRPDYQFRANYAHLALPHDSGRCEVGNSGEVSLFENQDIQTLGNTGSYSLA